MTVRHSALTARLMARYGGAVTLRVPGGRDPASPEWDPVFLPPRDVPVQMIETGAENDLISGGVVQSSDFVAAMLPHPEVIPTPECSVIVDGKTLAILSVKPVRSMPDGTVIHFVIQARG